MKQILTELKGGIDSSTVIVGDFNISYSIVYRTTKQRITTEAKDLDFPGNTAIKNPPANAGDIGSIPGLKDSTRCCKATKSMHNY